MAHYHLSRLPLTIGMYLFPLIYTIPTSAQHIQWTANWSHDQQYIAVGGNGGILKIFSGESFKLLQTDTIGYDINRLRWHPTENILAVAAFAEGSRLIDIDNSKTIIFSDDKNFGGRAIAWDPKGERIAIADYEGRLSIWDKAGNMLRLIPKENTISHVAVDWHPHEDEIITLSEIVRVYNTQGKLLQSFKHRKENVLMLCVQWHHSGDFYVLGDYGDYDHNFKTLLQYWNPDGSLMESIVHSKAEYRNISWNKKGKRLATASDALRIWNTKGKLLYEGESEDLLWGVDWSPDGKYIITSSEKGHIRLWDKKAKMLKELKY